MMVIYKPLKSTSTVAHILPDMAFTTLKHLYLKLRVTKQDDTPLDPPAGNVNITVYYDVYKTVSKKPTLDDVYQEVRKFVSRCPSLPPTEQRTLHSKVVPIPANGILVLETSFPKDAVSGRIQVGLI